MVAVGDIIFLIPGMKQIVGTMNDSLLSINELLIPKHKDGTIISASGITFPGQKIMVFPKKINTKIIYSPECPKFSKETMPNYYTYGDDNTWTVNTPLAYYDQKLYILGREGAYVGFYTWDSISWAWVVSPYGFTNATLDVDSNRVVWIASTHNNLQGVYYDGAWHSDTIHTLGGPWEWGYNYGPVMRIDNLDVPHILFEHLPGNYIGYIYYATYSGGAWSYEYVHEHSTAYQASPSALYFDSQNYPHFVFSYMDGWGTIYPFYGYKDGTGWHIEDLTPTVGSDFIHDFYIDNDNYPHIITGHYIFYKDGTGWHTDNGAWTDDVYPFDYYGWPRIKIDAQGIEYISYNSHITGLNWKYRKPGKPWRTCIIDTSTTRMGSRHNTNIELDTIGRSYLAYSTGYTNPAYLAHL